jgi:hypothetical protein
MPAAEEYGYVVVGSLDARNGPAQPVIDASNAVWQDVRKRFAVDEKRVYAAGFSGGAEMAAFFPHNILHRIAGIICCGTALPPNYNPVGLPPTLYFGIMGRKDHLFLDMVKTDRILDEVKAKHRILFFAGWHQWPSATLLSEALEWVELTALQEGTKESKPGFVSKMLSKRRLQALDLEKQNRWVESYASWLGIREDFAGLWDKETDRVAVEAEITRLSHAEKYRDQAQERLELENREIQQRQKVHGLFAALDKRAGNDLVLKAVSRELNMDDLINLAIDPSNRLQAETAQRLLSLIFIKADSRGFPARQRKDYPRAEFFFLLSEKASVHHPVHPHALYNLACVYSLWDKKKAAVEHLKKAVAAGFLEADVIANDPDLANIRSEPGFKDILKRLKLKDTG